MSESDRLPVIPPAAYPALLPLVASAARPRPGFWEAFLRTLGFASFLFGTLLGIIIVAVAGIVLDGGMDAIKPVPGANGGTIASVPPAIVTALAWSFPAGYLAGFVYAVVVCRVVIGRGWTREVGLRRVPVAHLGLGLLALPGFVILSDVMARFLFPLFGMQDYLDQSGDLGELFKPFHWSFAVLAVGVGPGVVEELWCRGFLGRGLVGRYGWAWGIALTSLFFGCLHLYPPPYVLVTVAMGVCLHFTYVVSRSLWVPISIHLLNNSFAALTSVGAIPTDGMDRALAVHGTAVGLLAVGLLAAAGLAMWTARARVVGDVAHRGVMVPPAGSGAVVVDHLPHPLFAAAAIGCSAALVWLLRG